MFKLPQTFPYYLSKGFQKTRIHDYNFKNIPKLLPLRQSLVIIAKIVIRLLCTPRIRIIWHSVKQNTGINVEAAVVVINIILMMNKFSSCVRSFQQMLRTDSDLVDKIKATCLLTLNSNQLPPHTHVCTVGKNSKKVCNFFPIWTEANREKLWELYCIYF